MLKADQERNVWIMLKEMTQSKQVAVRQLQTEPGLTPGYQNNGGHIYFVFRLLLLMLAVRLKTQQDKNLKNIIHCETMLMQTDTANMYEA